MPAAGACAACAARAGIYDEVPAAPAHTGCRWQVHRLDDPAGHRRFRRVRPAEGGLPWPPRGLS